MSKPHRRAAMEDIDKRNPVAIAMAKRRMAEVLRDQRIAVHLMTHGEDATTTLAAIGWALAMATQTAALVLPLDSPLLRRLHGNLRTVHRMCLDGYRWDSSQALALDNAMGEAHEVMLHHPGIAKAVTPLADHFSALIHAHRVQADTIVGAELYNQPTTEATA